MRPSRNAPQSPPIKEAAYAALRALPASPFFAMLWPSKTVACEAEVPGTPKSTAGIVSLVDVTAPRPSIKAKAEYASRLKVNGRSRARPATPPTPGMMPSARPIMVPIPR